MENIEMRQGIVINSVEVAGMVGKPHNDLMKDIRRYIVQFGEGNLSHSDYFTESEYISEQNKRLSCFLVTKKGCEFIAHKLTGARGTAFTVKYIDRFHEMEGRMADGQIHMPTGKQLMALAVLEAQKTIAEQKQAIERMRTKEIFADAVTASHSSILIGELAKIIRQNGIDTGEKRLFQWMRREGYLIRRNGTDYNMPTQRSMEMKLFEIRERAVTNPDGSIRITKTVLVTGKGQQYFINRFLQNQERS